MKTFRKAEKQELPDIRQLYWDVIDSSHNPGWVKDVYPSDDFIGEAIGNGELYILLSEHECAGVMILNHNCTDGYEKIAWHTQASGDDVMVIHVLAVRPLYGGKGVGKELVENAIEIAKKNHCKAIRLDVVSGNFAAQKLYEAMGFVRCGTVTLYYPCMGEKSFIMYEYKI